MKRHEKDLKIIKCDINIEFIKWSAVMSSNLYSNTKKSYYYTFLMRDREQKNETESFGGFP